MADNARVAKERMDHSGGLGLPKGAILCVVGARPNFMKIAPVMDAFVNHAAPLPACLVHTGQHYDAEMKHAFFDQLGIPEPDIDLEVGSGSHAAQTAEIMKRIEPVMDDLSPAAVLVVGDVNSTIASALVSAKKGIPVIHVEAGLRSFDRGMPEEINRVLTDQLSELLFTTERGARENLLLEGVADDKIHFVGNVMIDTLLTHRKKARPAEETISRRCGDAAAAACADGFAVLTLHRPSNVDDPNVLSGLLETVRLVSERIPVVFAVHPRTRSVLEASGLNHALGDGRRIFQVPPLGYLEMLGLMAEAHVVLTDSGGMQEESTALGVPCITLRENTERPITVDQGTNTIAGRDRGVVIATVDEILVHGGKAGRIPELWDGKAALRIREHVAGWMGEAGTASSAAL